MARGRNWTQSQQRPQGSSKASNPVVTGRPREGAMTVGLIPLPTLGQLIPVSTTAPLGENAGTLAREIFTIELIKT